MLKARRGVIKACIHCAKRRNRLHVVRIDAYHRRVCCSRLVCGRWRMSFSISYKIFKIIFWLSWFFIFQLIFHFSYSYFHFDVHRDVRMWFVNWWVHMTCTSRCTQRCSVGLLYCKNKLNNISSIYGALTSYMDASRARSRLNAEEWSSTTLPKRALPLMKLLSEGNPVL
jgi:hypothetical protein